MKTYLIRNTQSTYGYQLKVVDDEGNETFLDPIGRDPNTKNGLKLPDNPSNRKWISPKADVDEQEIPYKESRHFGPRDSKKAPAKVKSRGYQKFLTDEERKVLEDIKAKAERRAMRAKIEAEIAALTKMLNDEEEGE